MHRLYTGTTQLVSLPRYNLLTGPNPVITAMSLSRDLGNLNNSLLYKRWSLSPRNVRAFHAVQRARAASGSPAAAAIHLGVSVPASTPHRRSSSRASGSPAAAAIHL